MSTKNKMIVILILLLCFYFPSINSANHNSNDDASCHSAALCLANGFFFCSASQTCTCIETCNVFSRMSVAICNTELVPTYNFTINAPGNLNFTCCPHQNQNTNSNMSDYTDLGECVSSIFYAYFYLMGLLVFACLLLVVQNCLLRPMSKSEKISLRDKCSEEFAKQLMEKNDDAATSELKNIPVICIDEEESVDASEFFSSNLPAIHSNQNSTVQSKPLSSSVSEDIPLLQDNEIFKKSQPLSEPILNHFKVLKLIIFLFTAQSIVLLGVLIQSARGGGWSAKQTTWLGSLTIANATESHIGPVLPLFSWSVVCVLNLIAFCYLMVVFYKRQLSPSMLTAALYTVRLESVPKSLAEEPFRLEKIMSVFGEVSSIAVPLTPDQQVTKTAFITFKNVMDARKAAFYGLPIRSTKSQCGGVKMHVHASTSDSFDYVTRNFKNLTVPNVVAMYLFGWPLLVAILLGLKVAVTYGIAYFDDSVAARWQSLFRSFTDFLFGVSLSLLFKLITKFVRKLVLPRLHLRTSSRQNYTEIVFLSGVGAITSLTLLHNTYLPHQPTVYTIEWYNARSKQFTMILLADLFTSNVWPLIWNYIKWRVLKRAKQPMQFDVSGRTAHAVLVTSIVTSTAAAMPHLAIVGVVSLFVQYVTDRYVQRRSVPHAPSNDGVLLAWTAVLLSYTGSFLLNGSSALALSTPWLGNLLLAWSFYKAAVTLLMIFIVFAAMLPLFQLTTPILLYNKSKASAAPSLADSGVIDSFALRSAPNQQRHAALIAATQNNNGLIIVSESNTLYFMP